MRRIVPCLVALLVLAGTACSGSKAPDDSRIPVVAGFYPLAWAASQIGGTAVSVRDLTPVGGEAHDIQLTAQQRAAIQDAKLVLLLGKGFQPDVEQAVKDTSARVVDLLSGLPLRPPTKEELDADPHVWLDPTLMRRIVRAVGDALSAVDPKGREDHDRRTAEIEKELTKLDDEYRSQLAKCRLRTIVTTHEAFGYLAARYGLTQLALTGVTPEAEPSAEQIQRVRELGRQKKVAAVFFEATEEGRRIGDSVSFDAGVPALPLHTLEADPLPEDYLSQMRKNLARLAEGLHCR